MVVMNIGHLKILPKVSFVTLMMMTSSAAPRQVLLLVKKVFRTLHTFHLLLQYVCILYILVALLPQI